MNEDLSRLKQDVQTIQSALGLDIWTRQDVRRGFLGAVGGVVASAFLALWMFRRGAPEMGMLIYLALLQGIVILKAIGYRGNSSPSPGTRREVGFYNKYYFCGATVIAGYYFWGRRLGLDVEILFASTVVIAGMWYLFYGISSPLRSLSLVGAIPLIAGGFVFPEAKDLEQAFCWLGVVAGLGSSFEAALLFVAYRGKGSAGNTASPSKSPISPE